MARLIRSKKFVGVLLSLFSVFTSGAQNVSIGGIKYYLYLDSSEAVVSSLNHCSGVVAVPSEISYNGQKFSVAGITYNAFFNCDKLTKVIIPKTIDHFIHHTLSGEVLQSAVSPDYMNPFVGCVALESIEVEEGNPIMHSVNGVLYNKDETKLFCYPAGIKNERFVVPQTVSWIGASSFAGNSHLTYVELPASLSTLCAETFKDCKSLKDVLLTEKLTFIGSGAFTHCICLESIDVPTSVTGLGTGAFQGCTSLRKIILPKSVRSVGAFTFSGCELDLVAIRGVLDSQSVNPYLFAGISRLDKVYVPEAEISRYESVFEGEILPISSFDALTFISHKQNFTNTQISSTYDLQGRRLTGAPRKGVYIRDGRKVVVK